MRFSISDFRLAILLRAVALACVLVLCYWANLPWVLLVSASLLSCGAVAAIASGERNRARCLVLIWFSTALIGVTALIASGKSVPLNSYLDPYYAVVAWLLAAALWPFKNQERLSNIPAAWKLPAIAWLWIGTLLWLAATYAQNLQGSFYAGLAAVAGTSLLCLIWFRLPMLAVQALVTLMLLCAGLPIADLLLHPPHKISADPAVLKQYSTYQAAQKNPAGFEAWWDYFWNQWLALSAKVLVYEPNAAVPLRLRPNSEGWLVQSHIAINSLGFRGSEISSHKGDAYHIVAIGESSTFGFTINADDRPWPELLEELIRTRLKPERPVEVINAGLPSADLALNLKRFPSQILPLKPDLIISYHGINGFHLLDPAVPKTSGKLPPAYRPRPLRLLADCEYRAKLMLYRRAHAGDVSSKEPNFSNLMQTPLANAYRQLIEIAATNHIQLALCDFCMAANQSSPPEVVEFFHSRTPLPYRMIQANTENSQLLDGLANDFANITLIDTHPHLDGDPNQFIDLVHFNHQGELQMAENVFAGIKPVLQKALVQHSPATSSP